MRNHCVLLASLLSGALYGQTLPSLNPLPSRVVGHPLAEQLNLLSANPNLVEGRELAAPRGVAVDTSVSPPILYVSDTGNNRVLGWRDARNFRNGQRADLVIGQQDFHRTIGQGPGQTFSTGLTTPTGLLVDSSGNLYVADSGNNRILRFRKPFENQGNQFPDLFLGQPNVNSRAAGAGTQGLSLSTTSFPTNLAFDSAGNLWTTDPGNRRVLRFAAGDVASGGGGIAANLVVGQPDFNTLRPAVTSATRTATNGFAIPIGIAFDSARRLWVSDSDVNANVSRVLVFPPPAASDPVAVQIMGLPPSTGQDPKTVLAFPSAILFLAQNRVGILSTGHSRLLIFDPFDEWPAPTATAPSPAARDVVGQTDFLTVGPNGAASSTLTPPASATLFSQPFAAVLAQDELYIADTFNHRVIVRPAAGTLFGAASRVVGQDNFEMGAVNLIEGREFAFIGSRLTNRTVTAADAGAALDTTGDVPHLYVADTYNHRILGFRDFRKVRPGIFADIIIGQPNGKTGLCNGNGNPDRPNQTSLCEPMGLAVDAQGNLYVADHGNGRVLRFPAPFAQQGAQLPDLVLGQRDFTTKFTDPTASTMGEPYGLSVAQDNGLFVSDERHNRVLFFAFPNRQPFVAGVHNGIAATKVFGQPDFITVTPGNAQDKMNGPRHVSVDSEARLYVADTDNNRVLIFEQVLGTADRGAQPVIALTGINAPRAIFVNQVTDDAWVSESSTGLVRRYPRFIELVSNPASDANVQTVGTPLAIVQDPFGALAVADPSSRIAIYYPGLQGINAASYLAARPLAPGVFASACARASNCQNGAHIFGAATAQFSGYPLPKDLSDIEVLVDEKPSPVTYVSPQQINFVVPMEAPTSGTTEVLVRQTSTGRIYAAGTVNMNPVSPGIFMLEYTGAQRQAAIVNQDGTVNGPDNRAPRGSIVSIYATGQGRVPGAPPDGVPPTGLVYTPFTPRVLIGGISVDEYPRGGQDPPANQWIQFSGLSQYPGLWQINVHVPTNVPPGSHPIHVFANSVPSTDASSGFNLMVWIR